MQTGLPTQSLVWVEDQPVPTPLSSVVPGLRVLCVDQESWLPKYVEVTTASQGASAGPEGPNKLVNVTLEDDTTLELCENHPIFTGSLYNRGKSDVTAARDLKPLTHTVAVLKVVHVPVKSVAPKAGRQQATPTAAVQVKEPNRHAIVSAPPANAAGKAQHRFAGMAVGSTGLKPQQAAAPPTAKPAGPTTLSGLMMNGLRVKNTFLDIPTDGLSDSLSASSGMFKPGVGVPALGSGQPVQVSVPQVKKRQVVRSNSAPPAMVTDPSDDDKSDALLDVPMQISEVLQAASNPFVPADSIFTTPYGGSKTVAVTRNEDGGSKVSFSCSSFASWNSHASQGSGAGTSRIVQVGLQPNSAANDPANREARLGELLEVRAAGLSSIGSAQHDHGNCRPCKFHHLKGGEPCWKQGFCDRCHETSHAPAQRMIRRSRRGGARRQNGAAGELPGAQGDAALPGPAPSGRVTMTEL
eukprot:TRINITY_DN22209_c0_g1_i3.p1 TRINITY_DN22209_c0_g1~~TRINITY_DN22209_c0_g1_i3.p1  ORF type:complete len:468 (-),score=75.70 TRINITY_DN22209_c0_g1_i3:171-1574(-)